MRYLIRIANVWRCLRQPARNIDRAGQSLRHPAPRSATLRFVWVVVAEPNPDPQSGNQEEIHMRTSRLRESPRGNAATPRTSPCPGDARITKLTCTSDSVARSHQPSSATFAQTNLHSHP